MNWHRAIWPIITHFLVAGVVFTASFYAFGFLAMSAAINKCGTDTDYTIARSAAGERIGMVDSVCGWAAPGHNVQIYRSSADGKEAESVAHYSTNTFQKPRASWTPQGELAIEVPQARYLSIYPGVKSGVIVKFGRVQ